MCAILTVGHRYTHTHTHEHPWVGRENITRGGQLPPKWACSSNVPRVWAPKSGNIRLGINIFFAEHFCLRLPNLGGTCLVSRGVHPTFYHKLFIPDHSMHQFQLFFMV